MKAAGSTPPVSASSILAAGAASSHGRTLALSSPQPEPTSPCPQSPQKPPLELRGDVNGYEFSSSAQPRLLRASSPSPDRRKTAQLTLPRRRALYRYAVALGRLSCSLRGRQEGARCGMLQPTPHLHENTTRQHVIVW